MKTIVPSKKNHIIWTLVVVALVSSLSVKAQSSANPSFTNATLYSGTAGANNAVYKFPSVTSNMDALVKIVGRSSALVKLEDIDVSTTGFDKAFQPSISYNNGSVNVASTWYMDFQIQFVNKNTTTAIDPATFFATALDIDGDNNRLRERISVYNMSSYTLETPTNLSVSTLLQSILGSMTPGNQFTGTLTEHGGIDTSATDLMTTMKFNNASSIYYRLGAVTTGAASQTLRNYSLYFKNFSYAAPIVTLPIKLESFTATLSQNQSKADLKWVTASEINVNRFVVEKSYDGRTFSDAGIVFAYGNSSEKKSYSLTDNLGNMQQGVVYYRLHSIDNDGKSQLSETRIIRISKQGEALKMVTYPNPVVNELRVTVPATWQGKEVYFEVFNQGGQRMKAFRSGSASQTENIQMNELPAGFYLVKASCGADVAQQKIVKY